MSTADGVRLLSTTMVVASATLSMTMDTSSAPGQVEGPCRVVPMWKPVDKSTSAGTFSALAARTATDAGFGANSMIGTTAAAGSLTLMAAWSAAGRTTA